MLEINKIIGLKIHVRIMNVPGFTLAQKLKKNKLS